MGTQISPHRAASERRGHVHGGEAQQAAYQAADDEHGHEDPGADGAAGDPGGADEIQAQHHGQGGVAVLPVGAPRQQMPYDGVTCDKVTDPQVAAQLERKQALSSLCEPVTVPGPGQTAKEPRLARP